MKDSNRKENVRKFPNLDDCIVYCKFRGDIVIPIARVTKSRTRYKELFAK